eukprot:m51a1_g5347 hypothetical protein (219) ;mRNA; f:454940-455791
MATPYDRLLAGLGAEEELVLVSLLEEAWDGPAAPESVLAAFPESSRAVLASYGLAPGSGGADSAMEPRGNDGRLTPTAPWQEPARSAEEQAGMEEAKVVYATRDPTDASTWYFKTDGALPGLYRLYVVVDGEYARWTRHGGESSSRVDELIMQLMSSRTATIRRATPVLGRSLSPGLPARGQQPAGKRRMNREIRASRWPTMAPVDDSRGSSDGDSDN